MSLLPRHLAALRLLVLAGLVLGSTGCARLFSSYDVAPNGLSRRDDALRHLLVAGRADSALVRVEPKGESAPEDDLLRSLYSGILAHYAGSYESSGGFLEHAADLAEDRYTKRVSRAALSLISNDKVLPYEPGDTERLLIHYYAALNYLRLDDLTGAAVEARRLSALLEREEAPRDSTLHGWMRYLSGMIFEAAGERNDADVAYRNAAALLGPGVLPTEGTGPDGGMGEVVVLIEEGFVAHRVEQAIVVPLYPFELDRLSGGEMGTRLGAAAEISARIVAEALVNSSGSSIYYGTRPRTLKVAPLPPDVVRRECAAADTLATKGSGRAPEGEDRPARARQPDPAPIAGPGTVTGSAGGLREGAGRTPTRSAAPRSAPRPTQRRASRACADLRNPYLLRIAWPVFRLESLPRTSWKVAAAPVAAMNWAESTTDDTPTGAAAEAVAAVADRRFEAITAEPQLRSSISGAVARDFEAERGAVLARTILRGVAKAVVTRSIEKAPGEDGAELGRLLGALVNLGTALLEQADTRSWQLLPDQIGLVRLQLPPGEHELAVDVSGAGGAARRLELGTVAVRAGQMHFVSARVW